MMFFKKYHASIFVLLLLLVFAQSISREDISRRLAFLPPFVPNNASGETVSLISTSRPAIGGLLVISFDFTYQNMRGTNQFAVWIEDARGHLVKTMFVTRFTASGGYAVRPEAIPLWVKKSGIGEEASGVVDAVTGATPKSGRLSYIWDLLDKDGEPMHEGTYKFYVEGTTGMKNWLIYTGTVNIGKHSAVVEGVPHFSSEEAKLSDMIKNVATTYIP